MNFGARRSDEGSSSNQSTTTVGGRVVSTAVASDVTVKVNRRNVAEKVTSSNIPNIMVEEFSEPKPLRRNKTIGSSGRDKRNEEPESASLAQRSMTLGRTKKESAAFSNLGPSSPNSPADTSEEYMSASILSMRSIQLSQDFDGVARQESSKKGVSSSELSLSVHGRESAKKRPEDRRKSTPAVIYQSRVGDNHKLSSNVYGRGSCEQDDVRLHTDHHQRNPQDHPGGSYLTETPSTGVTSMASVLLSRGNLDEEDETPDGNHSRQPRFRAVSPKNESPTLAIQAMRSVKFSGSDLRSDADVHEEPRARTLEWRRTSKGDSPTLAIQAMRSVRLSSSDLRNDADAYEELVSSAPKLEERRSSKGDSPTLAIQAMRSVKLSSGDLRREADSYEEPHARHASDSPRSALSSKGNSLSSTIQAMRSVRLSSGDLRIEQDYQEEPLSKSVKIKKANSPTQYASYEISSSSSSRNAHFSENLGVKAMASVRLSHNRLDDADEPVYYRDDGISRAPSSTRISRSSSGRSHVLD
ncbi:hypothetical protein BJ742DRAFT_839407, partial [Cladochytrium replicatum]